jgi:hypothetical protein
MTTLDESHKFNDDLLLDDEDRNLANRKYPTIAHVLDHPELRHLFLQFDEPANRAKRKGRTAGFIAIGLGFLALALAALEYPAVHQTGEHSNMVRMTVAVTSALCGISGVLIGSIGLLFARRKQEWLRRRLMGELTRLFHFHTFVCRLPEILASLQDEKSKSDFVMERQIWLETFKARYLNKVNAAFVEMVTKDNVGMEWLHDGGQEVTKIRESRLLGPLFKAYRELRILHQISYTNYKLQDDHKILSAMPGRQAQIFAQFSLIAIVILFAIHGGVLLNAFFPGSVWAGSTSELISVIIIWIALAALAMRALEQGLQPDREFERYQHYRSALRAVLERFDRADFCADKVRIMQEMERLSFDELRDFLVTNNRSHFVL